MGSGEQAHGRKQRERVCATVKFDGMGWKDVSAFSKCRGEPGYVGRIRESSQKQEVRARDRLRSFVAKNAPRDDRIPPN